MRENIHVCESAAKVLWKYHQTNKYPVVLKVAKTAYGLNGHDKLGILSSTLIVLPMGSLDHGMYRSNNYHKLNLSILTQYTNQSCQFSMFCLLTERPHGL